MPTDGNQTARSLLSRALPPLPHRAQKTLTLSFAATALACLGLFWSEASHQALWVASRSSVEPDITRSIGLGVVPLLLSWTGLAVCSATAFKRVHLFVYLLTLLCWWAAGGRRFADMHWMIAWFFAAPAVFLYATGPTRSAAAPPKGPRWLLGLRTAIFSGLLLLGLASFASVLVPGPHGWAGTETRLAHGFFGMVAVYGGTLAARDSRPRRAAAFIAALVVVGISADTLLAFHARFDSVTLALLAFGGACGVFAIWPRPNTEPRRTA